MAPILAFLVALMLGLWSIGARNRLVRLRQDVAKAFPALELQLRKRHALARHLAEAAHIAAAAPRTDTEAVKAAAQQAATATETAHQRPADAAPMRQLSAAEEVLANALTALMPEEPADGVADGVTGGEGAPAAEASADPDPTLAELQARIVQLHAPLDYARQAYNAAVQAYNAALRVFPTTLAAALFRFQPAALLPRLSRPAR